ncbi:MAG TPA: hypothetical protein VHG69_12120 [Thermoleophilaceae bacterium]|nr:hypothetical protein [Thermoleophilaceae bacterium]
MEDRDERTESVKRVVLPSGKTIEVVLLGPADADQRPAELQQPGELSTVEHPPAEPRQDLHMCMGCGSDLVYPVDWEEAGPENWSVLLHCPNCDLHREGIFDQDTVEAFDEELDRGADVLAGDYKRLMRANMADEIERFVGALNSDAILPEDF